MKTMLLIEDDDIGYGGKLYGVSLDGSPNPSAEDYVRCWDKVDAERLVTFLETISPERATK